MKLIILWGQRKERHPGEFAPEPCVCWSEYEVDENGEGFEEACNKYQANNGSDFQTFRIIPVNVPLDKITELLSRIAPTIEGTIP